jgi:hypothetical protein
MRIFIPLSLNGISTSWGAMFEPSDRCGRSDDDESFEAHAFFSGQNSADVSRRLSSRFKKNIFLIDQNRHSMNT